MYQFNANDTTYTVPLDGLDLSTLNRSYDSGGLRPLWTVPREQYCEFKLNAWRISEESSDEETEGLQSESQICQICNTHVPIIYIKEHNNSIKHINMKKIYDLIIARGINTELNSADDVTVSKTNYYCEDCSIVVLRNNRQNHEESYTHKKSLRNKDLIEQFLIFYSKDLNENKSKAPTGEYYNKFINRRNLSFKIEVDDDDVKIIIEDYEVQIHNYNFHGFAEMDDELICILCEVKLQVNEIESHIASKKHRKKISRYIEDQHCIRELNDDFAHCLLCNEIVLSTRVAAHRVLTHHIGNLNQALGRKCTELNENLNTSRENSGFRQLSDELQSYDEESDDSDTSDVLQYIYESDDANVSDELKFDDDDNSDGCDSNEEISSGVVVDENNKIQKTNQTYCDICSVYIDTHNFKNHKMGSTHKQIEFNKMKVDVTYQGKIKNFIYKNLETNIDNISDNNVPGASSDRKDIAKSISSVTRDQSPFVIHYHMEETSYGIVRCLVCKIKMYIEDMNDHIKQDCHVNTYDDLLKFNKIIKRNDYMCYCQVCDDPVIIHNELNHINSIQHQNKICNEEDQICFETNINQASNKNNCIDDENPNPHTNTEKIEQIDDSTREPVESKQQDENLETEMEIPVDFIENINYQMLETTNGNATCKVCASTISDNAKDIFRHFSGEDHASKYSELLKTNRLTKAQNKFFCHVCKTSITSKNELEHIFGNKHKSKFPNHDIDVAYKISCQVLEGKISVTVQSADVLEKAIAQNTKDVTSLEVNEDLMSSFKTENAPTTDIENAQAVFLKQYYLVTKTKNPSKVICQVCHIMLTNSIINIESHMVGSDHKKRYEKLLKINGVTKQDNGFYCEACNVQLSNKNELIHINGIKHKSNVQDYAISSQEFIFNNNEQDISEEPVIPTSDTHIEASEVRPSTDNIENDATEAVDEINDTDVGGSSKNFNTSNDDEGIVKPSVSGYNNNQTAIRKEESENDHLSTATVKVQAPFSKPFYHVTKTANPAEVLCKVCNVLLTNSTVNIESHIMGFNHANKYKILIDSNGLKKENDRHFCGICKVFISNKNDIEHIMGYKHRARLPQDGDSIYISCVECNSNVPTYYMERHLTSPEHFMMKLMKDTTEKLDAMMQKVQELEEENARKNRALRVAYMQGRRQQF